MPQKIKELLVVSIVVGGICLLAGIGFMAILNEALKPRLVNEKSPDSETTSITPDFSFVHLISEDCESIRISGFDGELIWLMKTSTTPDSILFNETRDGVIKIFSGGGHLDIKVPEGAEMFILRGGSGGKGFTIDFTTKSKPAKASASSHLVARQVVFSLRTYKYTLQRRLR